MTMPHDSIPNPNLDPNPTPHDKPATHDPSINPFRPAPRGHMDYSAKKRPHLHLDLNCSSGRHKTSPRPLNHSSGGAPFSSPLCRGKLPNLATMPSRARTR